MAFLYFDKTRMDYGRDTWALQLLRIFRSNFYEGDPRPISMLVIRYELIILTWENALISVPQILNLINGTFCDLQNVISSFIYTSDTRIRTLLSLIDSL